MDWEKLADETLDVLKKDASELWENISETQQAIMIKAVKDLAKAELDIIRGKDVELNIEDIKFIQSTIATEADLVRYKAQNELRKAFTTALSRIVVPTLISLI